VSGALHWFRTDLRIRDNTSLLAAAGNGPVIALFIATPQQWQQHDDAPIKIDFWRRNLAVLEQDLSELSIPLLYAMVPAYTDIPALLEDLLPVLGVTALHCNREFPLNEHNRDKAVAAACRSLGITMHLHDDQVLLPPENVCNKSGEPFKVFTPWSRAVRSRLDVAGVKSAGIPARQDPPSGMTPAGCVALDDIDWPAPEAGWQQLWPAGEKAAQQALAEFCRNRIEAYRESRDLPGINGTSRISHFLAAGVLSIRDCWQQASAFHAGTGIDTWQNELLWRDFYKHVMWHFPRVCRHLPWKQDVSHVPWRHDQEEFGAWCRGETGIPIIDAAMRQLLQTGWMHNRLRMIVAMFLTKHLLIDWHWGERWFMQHLIDGDFAANNGGWQWSASTGTDAVPYFRIFNPLTQSQRFDPEGDFIRQYLPAFASLDGKSIHDPGLLAPQGYPMPMIDLAFGRERALNAFRRPG
jgi:deoxyribodipyrimidine photo-lyase